jgi:hypothetical protein
MHILPLGFAFLASPSSTPRTRNRAVLLQVRCCNNIDGGHSVPCCYRDSYRHDQEFAQPEAKGASSVFFISQGVRAFLVLFFGGKSPQFESNSIEAPLSEHPTPLPLSFFVGVSYCPTSCNVERACSRLCGGGGFPLVLSHKKKTFFWIKYPFFFAGKKLLFKSCPLR